MPALLVRPRPSVHPSSPFVREGKSVVRQCQTGAPAALRCPRPRGPAPARPRPSVVGHYIRLLNDVRCNKGRSIAFCASQSRPAPGGGRWPVGRSAVGLFGSPVVEGEEEMKERASLNERRIQVAHKTLPLFLPSARASIHLLLPMKDDKRKRSLHIHQLRHSLSHFRPLAPSSLFARR